VHKYDPMILEPQNTPAFAPIGTLSRPRTQEWEVQPVVAVDFDETISDAPQVWLQTMKCLETGGYQVVVVTWRSPTTYPEDLQFLLDKGYKVFYTSFKSKRQYMESLGIKVAIWIDDNPWAVDNDAAQIWS